jgi:hypothetical protein|tara:strand:- start:5941 stop:6240 length:300 start_codon:yes stop_codon:yes gene_type:complete
MSNATRLNESSEITIPVRNLIALIVATGIAVTGYFRLTERLSFVERNVELMNVQVEANSEFRVLWPRGAMGSLPADASQDMRLDYLEASVEELNERIGS